MFWDLQKTLMGKKTVINEIHQSVKRPDSIMSDILADIESNAMEAEKLPKAKVKSKPKIAEAEVIDGAVEE
jgi:fructose-specific component phosphotransferase system IIB-like protein